MYQSVMSGVLSHKILKPPVINKPYEEMKHYDPGHPTMRDTFSGALMTWGTSVESTAGGGLSVTRRFAR